MEKQFAALGKLVTTIIIIGIVVGGGYWLIKIRPSGNSSNPPAGGPTASPSPTESVEESPTPESKESSPTKAEEPETQEKKPTPTKAPADKEDKSPGKIEGSLGYPSEGIPPLEVYALPAGGKGKYYFVKTYQNQGKFEMEDVEPGSYYVVAYSNNLSGAYSKAVPCGLSVDCKDHSLIAVEVKPGETAKGAEVKDWYAPEGTFPKKPQ